MQRRIGLTVALAALVLLSAVPVAAQTGSWSAHTSFRAVRHADTDGARLWAATDGGVFGFDPATGEISRFTVVEGMHSVETRTLAADPARGVLWVGYGDGVMDRLDPETGVVRTFRDIERADQFAARGINTILPRGDSLLIATDFGIVVFDPVREEVRDSYTRLGPLSPAAVVHDLTVGVDNTIYAATEEGVALASLDGANLQDPGTWSAFGAGLFSEVLSVAIAGGSLFAGTEEDLYRLDDNFVFQPQSVSSGGVSMLGTVGGQLIGVERFRVFSLDPSGGRSVVTVEGYQNPTSLLAGPAGSFWMGDAEGGLLRIPDPASASGTVEVLQSVTPSGPTESQFADLSVGADGTLWAAATARSGSGFHRLSSEGVWTSYQQAFVPDLAGRSRFTRVHAMDDGSAWLGSEGNGVARANADGSVDTYDTSNSSLEPATGTFDFVIVGGVGTDSDDGLWVTTRGSGLPLHVRQADGSWAGLPPYIGEGLTNRSTAFGRVFVDSFDQKWIIVRDEANFNRVRGLMVLDTGSDPTDASDDSFRFYGQKGAAGRGLPATGVRAVVEDKDGLVWIGTDSGIAYFINTGVVARDQSAAAIWPPWADRSLGAFVLFGLKVNDLAVDPANRLWVATDEGAWLIASAELGYELQMHLTADNSPLFSDNILAIEVDAQSGEVYFSTDRGLVSLAGDAVAPSEEGGDLYIYPNPARDGEYDGRITIEGLQDRSDIRIVTPAGSLVAAFPSRGGRVVWDGRDRFGTLVPSGMYLVVGVPEEGGGAQRGRLAIIR